ncbi:MAG TPA: amino acid adenylation domain-containing protein, partial [Casimicrobiaceae bacterium]|nr:amino acid adenylation domain-containing protein [Casimicrobiaceae bacterium]
PKLAPLVMQYKDYAVWQRQRLSPERVAAEVAFWKAQLDGCEPVPLLTDRARPSIQSHRGDMIAVPLAPDTGDAVRRLATASGATPFMVLLAVFLVLLHRYSGATDIAVGTPIAARRRVEFEGLLGFFANMLVMRADLSGDPPFARFLESVREVALRGYDHAEVPFDTLVKELVAERDASRNPLFQIAFALEPAHRPALPLDGIEVQRMPLTTGHAKFDLTLTLRGQASQLVAEWEFSSALFDRATIQRMAACYATLLASALRDPQQRIGTIPMTMPDERRRILEQWSGAGTPWPAGFASIARKFDDQVARCPAAIALIHDSRTVTYAALDRRAIQLCAWMRMHGAAPGGVVGVAGDGSPEMVIAWLAVMKSGAAYLPLDPELPKQRLAFMIEDAGACLLVGTTGMLASMPATTLPVIDVERDVARIDECPVDDPGVACDQDALGCILYTSGSTGQPKGVMVRQSSIVRLVTANDYVELGPGDTVARIANVGFDAATFEIWGALLNGARLAHLSRNQALSAAAFANAIDAYGVTCALVTTAVFNAMLRERPNVFAKVDKLLFGGEACDTEAVRRAFTGGAPRRLVNLYGPTEATTIATYHVVDHAPGDKPVPIGRPIRGTEVFVLDAQLQPVPPDVPGEIYIGGTGVALGYVGNPAATRERFVDHPFAPGSGRRLFRTGDIARWDADGILRFVGRCDDQVKIRGVRIEPGEVRGALQRLPGVRAAHVVVHTSPSGERCLVAYVVAHDASNVSPDTLSAALASSLPRYMVPLAFVMVDTLPLTRNGKIDTHALPSPTLDSRSTRGHVAPRDDVERAICAVWESLLGLERVGLEDDFFECGGHSLLAVRMLIRLGAIADGLTVSAVFEAPTVRALADRCREHRQLGSGEAVTPRAM